MPTVKSQRVAENDATILLALNDFKKRKFKSVHATAGHHNVSHSTLCFKKLVKGHGKKEAPKMLSRELKMHQKIKEKT